MLLRTNIPALVTASVVALSAVAGLTGCDDRGDRSTAHTVSLQNQDSPQNPDPSADADDAFFETSQPQPAAGEAASHFAPGYVDDRECALCHRAIFRSYQDVGMARSFYPPDTDNVIEDFTDENRFYHEPSDRWYEFHQRDDGFFVKRYRLDDTGDEIASLEVPIDWIIGSGDHSRGYIYTTPSGEMFEIPIAWYTQTGEWNMAPGFDVAAHEDFGRQISRACMFCHNAYPYYEAGEDAFGQPSRFPEQLPHGIGCQRCHGPGEEHVRIANDLDATDDQIFDSIVGVKNLAPARRDDVCFQCHFQPTSKHTSFMRRFGVADYSYRPGEPLNEYLLHFDFVTDQPKSHRFEINHHPYRLLQSTCYQESDGAMSCLTCHDPHVKIPPREAPDYYRHKCMSCHAVDQCDIQSMTTSARAAMPEAYHGIADDNCIACHMPKHRTDDVVRVVMTDHLIARQPDLAAMQAPKAEQPPAQDVDVIFARPPGIDDPDLRDLHLAMVAANDGNLQAGLRLRELVHAMQPSFPEPYMTLGELQLKVGDHAGAVDSFARAIEFDPDNPFAHLNRGVALIGLGEIDDGINAIERSLELDPKSAEAHYNLGTALVRKENDQAAGRMFQRAIDLRPLYGKAHFNLGNVQARSGDMEAAVQSFQTAVDINLDDASAWRNLGTAHHALGNLDQARQAWQESLQIDPDQPQLRQRLAELE